MAPQHLKQSEPSTQIIGPPAYASPDPATNAGKLVDIEEHPFGDDLSSDYGAGVSGPVHVVTTTMTADSVVPEEDDEFSALPEGQDDWTLDQWRVAAKHYGLGVGGNKKQVSGRVTDYQDLIEGAGDYDADDWEAQIVDTDNADDLADLRALYGHVGASFDSVPEAFDARQSELTNEA